VVFGLFCFSLEKIITNGQCLVGRESSLEKCKDFGKRKYFTLLSRQVIKFQKNWESKWEKFLSNIPDLNCMRIGSVCL